jgi:serine/threonine protein kinase
MGTTLTLLQPSLLDQVIARYKIIQELGRGAMGEVYLAEDINLQRKVAIKFLAHHYAFDPEIRARFQHEAKAAAQINHPNVITIHHVDEFEGRPYIVMEYVEGESLKELIARKELAIDEIVNIALQISEGLSKAHQQGVLHRDIKPANILIEAGDGRVKIADFGLAKSRGSTKITMAGALMGTAPYMSPEQARGEELDHRSDIFSFGVVLYELIARQLPFKGDTWEASLYAKLHQEPEPLSRYKSGVSAGLQSIVSRALDKDRETRYQSMDSVLADLKREKKITFIPPTPRKAKSTRQRWPKWLPFFAVILLLVIFVWNRLSVTTTLSITTAPVAATVFVNGDSIGVAPIADYKTKAGPNTLRIQAPGYVAVDTTVVMEKGKGIALSFSLNPPLSATKATALQLRIKPYGTVYIDDTLHIREARDERTIELTAGLHKLRIEHPTLGTWEKTIAIAPDSTHKLTIDFIKTAALTVASEPVWANIFVDGKPTGQETPKKLRLRVGLHTIEVRREGYVVEGGTKRINLEKDLAQPMVFTLKKLP